MLTRKIEQTMLPGLSAIILGIACGGGAATDCGKNECDTTGQSYRLQSGFYLNSPLSPNYADNKCPDGCSKTGETSTRYCCWCPDDGMLFMKENQEE